ncbi:Spy/CpxP family protein refolding chaperone [Oxalobacter aliiformigenes]|uniref:Spy/CpxP family protein refolding chaperone n=1 Tax=Oxalobacter aliiformigenes TaxID=2946593 RepID=UPI0022B017FB|nr:Spy/CpxP family protein refolding chaperone [Oxalobacter aliiformigenes]MCZ4064884.1 Spy/CpxP family protein refolding chaperone [Oxalobacter aliiformigenes]WAV98994.1 Spy/CpxP family protein refolding chaperone [Oxalobacter aliiformigenes]
MKKLNKYLVAGIAALGFGASCFSVSAFAQSADETYGGCPMYTEGGPGNCYADHDGPYRGHHERWREYHHRRQLALHDKLKLNAEQEKAWTAYLAVVDKNINSRKPLYRADLEKMTAPERMQTMIDRMKTHEKELTEQLAALKVFYAKLTPEQQGIFDNESMYYPRHRRGGPMK